MATTVTGEEILRRVIAKTGDVVGITLLTGEFTLSASALTSLPHFRSGYTSTNHFYNQKAFVYWPGNPTGMADYVRTCGDLTAAGALSFNADYASGTAGSTAIYITMRHPSRFLDALLSAMRICFTPNLEPLSTKPTGTTLADAGFQNSATTHWVESDVDGGAATGFTKITTANSENVFRGVGAGRVLNTAAGGYIRQRFAVVAGEPIIDFALTRLDAGTNFEHVLQDVTGAAAIGTTVEHAEEAWRITRRQETVPTSSKIVEVRLQGEGASDDFYVNGHWFYRMNNRRLILDTLWQSDEWSKPRLLYVNLKTSGTSDGDVFDAFSSDLREIPADEYDWDIEESGANPQAVQFHSSKWFNYPIYIEGRRALSDLTTFTLALSQTTPGDLDLISAATRVEMFKRGGGWADDPAAPILHAEAQQEFDALSAQKRRRGPTSNVSRVLSRGLR